MELLLVLIGLAVLAVVVGIPIYNGIIKRKNAVERAWAGVITQERQKNQILPDLESVVKQHKEFESRTLEDITRLRSHLDKLDSSDINTQVLAEVESAMSAIKKGLQLTVEAYPELRTADLMQKLMKEITEQQENVGAALRIFNQNVEAFNSGIQVFPNSLVNQWFNRESKIKTFSDSEAESGFEYRLK